MKILEVNKLYHPWIGGVEKTVQDIAEGVNKTEGYDMEVLVCQERGRGGQEEINGVKIWRASSLGMLLGMPISFSFLLLFRKISKQTDVLHVHLPFPLATVAYLLFRPKAKLIVHYHSDIVRQKITYIIFKPLLKVFLRKADVIIATSPRMIEKSKILRLYKEKCQVVSSGVDLSRFILTGELKEKAEEIRKKLGTPLILFVGRLIYYKGLEYLVRAFRDTNAQLVIIGSGPLKKKLENMSEKFNISERIHFFSGISDKELTAFYYACDVFVLSSIISTEALGLVQIEAMACEKPVISANLPTGVPWLNQDQKTGLVVPSKDEKALSEALNRLLKDKSLREKYGRSGKERAKQFSKEMMIKKVLKIYFSVCRP